jgi:hypothetical protein
MPSTTTNTSFEAIRRAAMQNGSLTHIDTDEVISSFSYNRRTGEEVSWMEVSTNPFSPSSFIEAISELVESPEEETTQSNGWAEPGITFAKASRIFGRDFRRFSRARNSGPRVSNNTRIFMDGFKKKITAYPMIVRNILQDDNFIRNHSSMDPQLFRAIVRWVEEAIEESKPNPAKEVEKRIKGASIFDPFRIHISDLVMVRAGNSSQGQIFEVIGMRSGGDEILVAPTDLQRRGNVSRFPHHRLMVVGSSWPKEEKIDKETELSYAGSLKRVSKDDFFSLFQIGLEIEGEFYYNAGEISYKSGSYFNSGNIVPDASVYPQDGTGNTFELNSPIIQSLTEETIFISALNNITHKRFGGFASKNNTAGTHIHLDFRPTSTLAYTLSAKGFHPESEILNQELLRVFNSVEFEKFFFNRYFEEFKTKKFYVRPGNSYCKAFLKRFGFLSMAQDMVPEEIEMEKARAGKYKWLNFKSLERGMGIEFRIFPYLTTVAGVKQVIDFTQSVVMEYFQDVVTADDLYAIEHAFLESRKTSGYFEICEGSPWLSDELTKYTMAHGGRMVSYLHASHDLMKVAYKIFKTRKETK